MEQRRKRIDEERKGALNAEQKRIARLERRLLKLDARYEWMRQNNMKEVCVKLTDVRQVYQDQYATFNTFSTPITLDANTCVSYESGSSVGRVPQREIWNLYAEMYEYWMVDKIELEFYPISLEVETTATGTQDTATFPTVASLDSDTNNTFWAPASNLVVLQEQQSALAAKKGFEVHPARSVVRREMTVSNTLLLKQAEPMLKTNGSITSRETYSNDLGSIVIIPSRLFTNRVPFGIAKYSIWYRFAGVHQPSVAIDRPVIPKTGAKAMRSVSQEVRDQQSVTGQASLPSSRLA